MPGASPSLTKFAPYFAARFADAQIADEREAEAAADRVTVERADDRHLEIEQRQERRVHRVRALVRARPRRAATSP